MSSSIFNQSYHTTTWLLFDVWCFRYVIPQIVSGTNAGMKNFYYLIPLTNVKLFFIDKLTHTHSLSCHLLLHSRNHRSKNDFCRYPCIARELIMHVSNILVSSPNPFFHKPPTNSHRHMRCQSQLIGEYVQPVNWLTQLKDVVFPLHGLSWWWVCSPLVLWSWHFSSTKLTIIWMLPLKSLLTLFLLTFAGLVNSW